MAASNGVLHDDLLRMIVEARGTLGPPCAPCPP